MTVNELSHSVPVYQSTRYVNSSGSPISWGLSLDANGTAAGYLSTTAPDGGSSANPFIQSNGLLLQGLTGTASAYLWSCQTQPVTQTDHFNNTSGSAPAGYSFEGITSYLDESSGSGTAPLYRYVNATSGRHY